jgi:Cell division protein
MKDKKTKKNPLLSFLKVFLIALYLVIVAFQITLMIQTHVHKNDAYTFDLLGISGFSIKESTSGDAKKGDLYITDKAATPERLLPDYPVVFKSNNAIMSGKIAKINNNRVTLTSGEDIYSVDFSNVFGNVKARLPYVGYIVDFMTGIIGIVVVLAVPALLIIILSFIRKKPNKDSEEFEYNDGVSELPYETTSAEPEPEKKPFDAKEIHKLFEEQAALRAKASPQPAPQPEPHPKQEPAQKPEPASASVPLTGQRAAVPATAPPESAQKPTPITPVPLVTPTIQPKVVAPSEFSYEFPKREAPFVDENKTILLESTDQIPVTPMHQDDFDEYFEDYLNKNDTQDDTQEDTQSLDDTQPLTITTNEDGVPLLSPADEETDELSPVPDRITIPKTTFVTPKSLAPPAPPKPKAEETDGEKAPSKSKSVEFVIDTAQTKTVWLKMKTDGSGVEIVTDNYTASFDTLNE